MGSPSSRLDSSPEMQSTDEHITRRTLHYIIITTIMSALHFCNTITVNISHLFIQLKPSRISFAVHVLQTEKPNFAQTNSLHHLKGDTIHRISVQQFTSNTIQ